MREGIIFFDLETTGLNAWNNEITEIGAITNNDDEFQCLVKTQYPITEFISNLTGITNQMLEEEGISLKNAIERFRDFIINYSTKHNLEKIYIVAHNCDGFDKLFIRNKFNKVLGHDHLLWGRNRQMPFTSDPQINFLCTKLMAQTILPPNTQGRNFSLQNLCNRFEISNLSHHRALNDAVVCKNLFHYLYIGDDGQNITHSLAELYENIYGTQA